MNLHVSEERYRKLAERLGKISFAVRPCPELYPLLGTLVTHQEALPLEQDVAVVESAGCIGCGVRVTGCDSQALTLVPRSEHREPPKDFQALVMIQMQGKAKSTRAPVKGM